MLACATAIQNFKCLFISPVFLNKYIKCGYVFSKFEQEEQFATKTVWLCRNFSFRSFSSDSPCSIQRKANLKNIRWWHMRKRIDHWCSVSTGQSQLSGPPFQWETRQGSFPTGTVDPRVGIFLSLLNTNDGFCLSYIPLSDPWDR